MPAAGVTAKLPSPLDNVKLPSARDRHEPLPSPAHHEPPASLDLDHHEPLPPSAPHESPPSSDHHEPLPPPAPHELPPSSDHHEPPPSLDFDPVQEGRCLVGPVAVAWAAQDAELDAEIAALEAAGVLTAPAEEEQPGPDLDPDNIPPHGLRPWLAGLSGSPFDECLVATADATGPEMPRTTCRDRVRGGGLGFAADGDADLLSPGAALAGLAEQARAAGLSRLTDDELAGVIRAGRRLSSWASALELAAVSDL